MCGYVWIYLGPVDISLDIFGYLLTSILSCGYILNQLIPLDICGCLWISVYVYANIWPFLDICQTSGYLQLLVNVYQTNGYFCLSLEICERVFQTIMHATVMFAPYILDWIIRIWRSSWYDVGGNTREQCSNRVNNLH